MKGNDSSKHLSSRNFKAQKLPNFTRRARHIFVWPHLIKRLISSLVLMGGAFFPLKEYFYPHAPSWKRSKWAFGGDVTHWHRAGIRGQLIRGEHLALCTVLCPRASGKRASVGCQGRLSWRSLVPQQYKHSKYILFSTP